MTNSTHLPLSPTGSSAPGEVSSSYTVLSDVPEGQRDQPPIGVIGGSGFYSWLDDAHEVPVTTPFGDPSEIPVLGRVAERPVVFLPRHGRDHRFPPHRVPYRANLWALRALGVRQILAPCAVGSMRPELEPGSLVLPDQIIDRTSGRDHTIYDGPGPVVHIPFADPYCPHGRMAVLKAAHSADWKPWSEATLVVINGPRFSTRAESQHNAASGGEIVGMTGMPEASLARELALCYTSIAVVTDHDAGFDTGEGVTQDEVFQVFARSIERLKTLLEDVMAGLPDNPSCACRTVLEGMTLPFTLP
jgi:5'-methylthioadenosine phosphorylase